MVQYVARCSHNRWMLTLRAGSRLISPCYCSIIHQISFLPSARFLFIDIRRARCRQRQSENLLPSVTIAARKYCESWQAFVRTANLSLQASAGADKNENLLCRIGRIDSGVASQTIANLRADFSSLNLFCLSSAVISAYKFLMKTKQEKRKSNDVGWDWLLSHARVALNW